MNNEFEFQVGDIVECYLLNGEHILQKSENCFYPLCIKRDSFSKTFTKDGKLCTSHDKPILKLLRRPKEVRKVKLWQFVDTYCVAIKQFHTEDKNEILIDGKLRNTSYLKTSRDTWIKTNCFIEAEVEE